MPIPLLIWSHNWPIYQIAFLKEQHFLLVMFFFHLYLSVSKSDFKKVNLFFVLLKNFIFHISSRSVSVSKLVCCLFTISFHFLLNPSCFLQRWWLAQSLSTDLWPNLVKLFHLIYIFINYGQTLKLEWVALYLE